MSAWLSWSSGKDSAWALHVARQQGVAVSGLLTTVNEAFERVAMHGVREEILRAQAAAAGLPIHVVKLPWPCSNEIYEERMEVAIEVARAAGVTQMIFGDLFLEDIRRYREDKLRPTGIDPLFPLWGRATHALAEEMIEGGLEAFIATLDPKRLEPSLACHRFDRALLSALPADVDPCFENGEAHTCVVAGPMFDRRIDVEVGERVSRDGFVYADLVLRGS